ncbi:MAG: hypothetical protein JMDDDDMK_00889 [Acidobacteria bacterium]|nr:hypothetical protein [Acidobacteriota bacterium]
MRQISRTARVLVRADNGEREVADVGVELVHVSARTAVDVREKQLLLAFSKLHLRHQLELAVTRFASAAQNQRVLPLHDFRVDDDDARRIAAQIIRAQPQPPGERVFDLGVPRRAVWGEVAHIRSASNERIIAALGLVRDVEEAARAVNHRTVGRINRHHLFGIFAERINAQRHAVVKDSIARAEHCLLALEWSPRKTGARRQTERFGDSLTFKPQPQIERELLRDNPMILAEGMSFQVFQIERRASGEFDAAQPAALFVEDVHGTRGEFALVRGARDDRAEFQIVRAHTPNRFERDRFHPLGARRVAILLAEIISGVARRRQIHLGDALPPDVDRVLFDRDRAFEQVFAQRQTVNQRARVILALPVRRDWSAIEKIQVDEAVFARREMERAGQRVRARNDVIELRERID